MNHIRTAAPRNLLARAYLEVLAADAGSNAGLLLRSGDKEDPIERLFDDLPAAPESVGKRVSHWLQPRSRIGTPPLIVP